ncbi:MAG: hypothetical protein A2017_13590 [Lentisphaerae bacterium GWF2_44_16]|nr:MAG: hypothetical protein A2017_13590 [Lentisphaerae bacterium GWF2_44_16]
MSKGKLYEKIADYLKNAIEKGELKIGEAIYSEPELCAKFNVSRTSVRKAIRQLAGENILVSRQGLGTFVKGDGHGLIHNTVCLVNHWTRSLRYDRTETYYMDEIFGIESECSRRQINFQMFSGIIKSKDELLTQMQNHKLDGIVLDGNYQTHEKDIKIFKNITPHIVVLDGNPAETDLPCMVPDEITGYEKILQLAARHKNICFLHETMSAVGRRKLAAFKKALKKYRLTEITFLDYSSKINYDNFYNVDHYPLVYYTLNKFLENGNKPEAIICAQDHAAIKTINILKQKNFIIPDDISVFGFSGMTISEMTVPPLSTVKLDSSEMGKKAVEFLCDIIQGKTEDKIRCCPVTLLERASHK